jgi:hypothetical protein
MGCRLVESCFACTTSLAICLAFHALEFELSRLCSISSCLQASFFAVESVGNWIVRRIVETTFLELLETRNRKHCLLEASSGTPNNRIPSQRIDWSFHRFGYPFCNEMTVQSRGGPLVPP